MMSGQLVLGCMQLQGPPFGRTVHPEKSLVAVCNWGLRKKEKRELASTKQDVVSTSQRAFPPEEKLLASCDLGFTKFSSNLVDFAAGPSVVVWSVGPPWQEAWL